jgi:hypothetical protein
MRFPTLLPRYGRLLGPRRLEASSPEPALQRPRLRQRLHRELPG